MSVELSLIQIHDSHKNIKPNFDNHPTKKGGTKTQNPVAANNPKPIKIEIIKLSDCLFDSNQKLGSSIMSMY
tara:strand:- start:497 stop:712 length:216 start_codon:yes stop_codon:yes gene_type:complete